MVSLFRIFMNSVSCISLRWFCSYLSSRFQRVTTPTATAGTVHCSRGVPQGFVLGPLLFCIYIRDVPAQFRHLNSQLYADDIAFYNNSTNIVNLCADLTEDLNLLDKYLTTRGLLLNPKKTQFVVLHKTSCQMPPACCVSCRDVTIERVQTATYLGVVIDQHLSFVPQVDQVIRKVDAKLGAFRHGRRNLTFSAKRTFYLSVVQSSIDYASSAYVHLLTSVQYNRLVVLSHRGMKKVFGLDRLTPTHIVLQHAHLYPIEHRFNSEGQGFICQWKQSRFQLNIRNNLSKCRGQKVPQFVMPSRGIPARRTHERMIDGQCLTTSTPLSKIKQSETIPDSKGIPKVPLAEDRGGG